MNLPEEREKTYFYFFSQLILSKNGSGRNKLLPKMLLYRAFHRFGQAKFVYGGPVLGLSQFLLLPQLPQNDARFKSGLNKLKNNHLASLI